MGIGMRFAATAEANADIESTLVFASALGMDGGDLRVLAVLTTWLGVHHTHVDAGRLVRLVSAHPSERTRAYWAAIAAWLTKDRRLGRLAGAYAAAPVELLTAGNAFQMQRRGEDERFTGSVLRAPKGTLRDRHDDVLAPEVLVRRHAGYRNRVLMGPRIGSATLARVASQAVLESQVHHGVLRAIVDHGHAPTVDELASALGVGDGEVRAALHRLHDGHGLVLHPGRDEVWVAHPFSLSPTAVWVASGDRGWWAPCLWCGFGIQALVGAVDITVRLGGETDTIVLRAGPDHAIAVTSVGGAALAAEPIAHFPLPPRQAWDNVSHFCAQLLPFRDEAQLDGWFARHRLPRGVVMPLGQLQQLAERWYGHHLERDWVKWTPAQAAAIFASCGLDGDFWALDLGAARF